MITLCVPTRERPESMRRLYNSIVNTAHFICDIELVFYIDDDDVDSQAMYRELDLLNTFQLQAVIGPRIVLSQMWNECYKAGAGPIYMICADDIVFESKQWDLLVQKVFDQSKDKILLVYGDDGGKGERLSTHPFIHENWIKTVGYFTPPYFHFCMCDKWLFEIACALNRKVFIKEIMTAHWNCTNRKYCPSGQPDKTWLDMHDRGEAQDYRGEYHKRGKEREEAFRKLQDFIRRFV